MNICFKGGVLLELRLDWYMRLCDLLFAAPGALLDSLLDEGLQIGDEVYHRRRQKSRHSAERRALINDLMGATVDHCESLFTLLVREIRDEAAAEKVRKMLWELNTMLPDMNERSKKTQLNECDWTAVIAFFAQIEREVWKHKHSIVPLAQERVGRLLEHARTSMVRLEEYKREDELLDEEREMNKDYYEYTREQQREREAAQFIERFWE